VCDVLNRDDLHSTPPQLVSTKRHSHTRAPHAKAQNATTMDPDVFEQWRKEQQARIDERIANGEEIHVPLHNLFWSDGRADKVPGTKSDLTRQEDTTDYLKLLSEKYCMLRSTCYYDMRLTT
jgi:hypothetical protein